MPITDPAAQEPSTQAHQAATVDAATIANAVVQGIRTSGMLNQQAAPAPKKDLLKEAIEEIGDSPEHEPVKQWQAKFAEGIVAKVTDEVSKKYRDQSIAERQAQDTATVKSIIEDEIAEKHPGLKNKSQKILNAVIHEFTQNPEHEAARQQYNATGVLDQKYLKKLAKAEIAEYSPAPAPQAKSATGMTERDGGADIAPSNNDAIDESSLYGRERELWDAKMVVAQKAGMKRNSEAAKNFCASGIRKYRDGKQAAKAKFGASYIYKDER